MQPYTPVGTLYAATALRERGISVAVFDSMLEEALVCKVLWDAGEASAKDRGRL